MLVNQTEERPGNVVPEGKPGEEAKLQTIVEETNVINEVSEDSDSKNAEIDARAGSSVRNSDISESNDKSSVGRNKQSFVSITSNVSVKNVSKTILGLSISSILIGVGTGEAMDLSSITSTSWTSIGAAGIAISQIHQLPGYFALLLARLRITTEGSNDPTESKKGVHSILEMIGLMQEESRQITEVLQVDKVSNLVRIKPERLGQRLKDNNVNVQRIEEILEGFIAFQTYYYDQDRDCETEDGVTIYTNRFSVTHFTPSMLRRVIQDMSKPLAPTGSVNIRARNLFEDVSTIQHSNSISEKPSTESEETVTRKPHPDPIADSKEEEAVEKPEESKEVFPQPDYAINLPSMEPEQVPPASPPPSDLPIPSEVFGKGPAPRPLILQVENESPLDQIDRSEDDIILSRANGEELLPPTQISGGSRNLVAGAGGAGSNGGNSSSSSSNQSIPENTGIPVDPSNLEDHRHMHFELPQILEASENGGDDGDDGGSVNSPPRF